MEPTESQFETTGQKATLFAPLFRVTPLSKYLALALFILLPFVGGVVGYWYAEDKISQSSVSPVNEIQYEQKDKHAANQVSETIEQTYWYVTEGVKFPIPAGWSSDQDLEIGFKYGVYKDVDLFPLHSLLPYIFYDAEKREIYDRTQPLSNQLSQPLVRLYEKDSDKSIEEQLSTIVSEVEKQPPEFFGVNTLTEIKSDIDPNNTYFVFETLQNPEESFDSGLYSRLQFKTFEKFIVVILYQPLEPEAMAVDPFSIKLIKK